MHEECNMADETKDPVKDPAPEVKKDAPKQLEPGHTKLVAPDGASSVSFAGKEYSVEDGAVAVPHAAVPHLLPHGYTVPKSGKKAS
jgi:hypothetical protein